MIAPDWFRTMFMTNQGIIFHALGALVIIALFWKLNDSKWGAFTAYPLMVTLLLGIAWELFELYYEGWELYGTLDRYLLDTSGDLLIIFPIFLIYWYFNKRN